MIGPLFNASSSKAKKRHSQNGEHGFTLTEVLVALFILALISSAGTGLMIGASSSSKQVKEQEQVVREIDLAQSFLRGDISAMSPRAVLPEWNTRQPGNLFGQQPRGAEPFLRFVRNGWIVSDPKTDRSSLQYVSYRIEDEALIRSVWTRPDRARQTSQVERVLLDEVSTVELRFRRGVEWSEEWIGDAGQELSVLPDLIELDIRFLDGTSLMLAMMTGGRQ